MPVQLSHPAAVDRGGYIEVDWATALDSYLDYRILRTAPGGAEQVIAEMSGEGIPGFRYADHTATPGVDYAYRIAYRFDGIAGWAYSPPVHAIAAGPRFSLGLPHPNPTRGLSRMNFELPRAGRARLEIFDVTGRRVRTVLDRALPAGPASASWDGLNRDGDPAPSGVYFARLALETQSVTRKLLVIR